MMLDVSDTPFRKFVYDYGHVCFVGGRSKGSRVSRWLTTLRGTAAGIKFSIPKLQESVFGERYPSHSDRNAFLGLSIPHSFYRINILGKEEYRRIYNPLVTDGCPSFPNINTAASRLLYEDYGNSSERNPEDIIVRIAHPEAWIEKTQLSLTAATITIVGPFGKWGST